MAVLKYRNSQGNYVPFNTYLASAYQFDGTYDATTNKAATVYSVTSRMPTNMPASQGGTDNSLVTTGDKYKWNEAYAEGVTFERGANTQATVASVPVTKGLVIVTIVSGQTAQAFSLGGITTFATDFPSGREVHIIVDNSNNSSDLTVTIPHGGNLVNVNDMASGTMTIAKNKIGEINVLSNGTKGYIRYVGA